MNTLSEKEIKATLKADLSKCSNVFYGQKVRIYKTFKLNDSQYDLIYFKNGASAVSKTATHTVYIEFGDYLIQAPIPNICLIDCIDFTKCKIYNISTGEVLNSNGCPEIGVQNKSDIIIVDSRILVVCKEKTVPQFFIIIDENLVEIDPSIAEHLLNIADFSKEHVASLLKFYPNEPWSVHNGLVLNHKCGLAPSQTHLEIWKRTRRVRVNLKKGIDPKKLLFVFKRGSRPAIRHLSMENV